MEEEDEEDREGNSVAVAVGPVSNPTSHNDYIPIIKLEEDEEYTTTGSSLSRVQYALDEFDFYEMIMNSPDSEIRDVREKEEKSNGITALHPISHSQYSPSTTMVKLRYFYFRLVKKYCNQYNNQVVIEGIQKLFNTYCNKW